MRQFRPSLKHIVIGGLGSSIGLLGIVCAVALYIVEVIIHPKKQKVRDLYTFTPFELGLPAEAVVFPPLHGDYQVRGWYIPSLQATTTLLVCPGYRTGMSAILGISAHLWQAGHNVLVFEYYGHGTEVGKPVTLGYREVNDFLGAIVYAKQRTPHARLGVIAYSMGAAVAIMSCARNDDVEALVVDSPFATHRIVFDYNFRHVFHLPPAPFVGLVDYLLWVRAGYHFHQVEPLCDISHIAPRPILIIQSTKDSTVDPHDAALLYAAAGEPKELWLVAGLDHCGAYFADRYAYTKKVADFFDLHLRMPRLKLVGEEHTRRQGTQKKRSDAIGELSEAS